MDKLLTVQEAAKALRLDATTVYLMCQRHELPHVRFGKRVLLPEADLAEYVRSITVRPEPVMQMIAPPYIVD